ncbi:MAG: magnesium/cobalt transporter CorA [Sphingobacteriaceae bacterium]|nr:magnesium/cobalt transporter CorA [Sphingobacteriaceae bacterium]
MAKRRKNNKNDIGLPPGTLVYNGKVTTERVKITLIEYNETEYFEREFYDLSECMNHVKKGMVKWMNVEGIHKTELIEAIGKHYDIHSLTLEDLVHIDQRSKFEEYEHYALGIMKMITFDGHIHAEQLSLILVGETVLSFQEPFGGDAFDVIRTRLRQAKGRVRKLSADYLFYALIDAVVDSYFTIVEKIGDAVEEIEEEIMNNENKSSLKKLYELKRELIFLRKQVWPMRDMINSMMRSESDFISKDTHIFLRDLLDHSTRIIDTVETYRDLLSGIMDVYLSNASNRMNEVMKVLTIVSSIFIPATFIVGVYGMNFDHMPELREHYGYPIVWAIMLAIMIGQLIFFKRKKWL